MEVIIYGSLFDLFELSRWIYFIVRAMDWFPARDSGSLLIMGVIMWQLTRLTSSTRREQCYAFMRHRVSKHGRWGCCLSLAQDVAWSCHISNCLLCVGPPRRLGPYGERAVNKTCRDRDWQVRYLTRESRVIFVTTFVLIYPKGSIMYPKLVSKCMQQRRPSSMHRAI